MPLFLVKRQPVSFDISGLTSCSGLNMNSLSGLVLLYVPIQQDERHEKEENSSKCRILRQ